MKNKNYITSIFPFHESGNTREYYDVEKVLRFSGVQDLGVKINKILSIESSDDKILWLRDGKSFVPVRQDLLTVLFDRMIDSVNDRKKIKTDLGYERLEFHMQPVRLTNADFYSYLAERLYEESYSNYEAFLVIPLEDITIVYCFLTDCINTIKRIDLF